MNNNINWEEVENKIAIICNKFSNLSEWREDLAQELRIHAYYTSDNYYDLYRKAIDFWRKIQTKHSPEVPYFDLEVLNPSYDDHPLDQLEELVILIRKELDTLKEDKWDRDKREVCKKLLDIMLADINPKYVETDIVMNKSSLQHYRNKRLNISWVAEETGIGYKRLVVAMRYLEDTVRGLAAMNKIEIPIEYFRGYYD